MNFRNKYDDLARYSLMLMVMCLSHTTAGANVALLAFLIFGFLSKRWNSLPSLVYRNSYFLLPILLFSLLALSLLWVDGGVDVGIPWLTKYKKLLLIPLAYPFFVSADEKRLFLKALFISLFIGMVISYLNFVGLMNYGDCPTTACTSHTQITLGALNNLLFILSIYYLMLDEDSVKWRFFYLLTSLFAAYSILFILGSRTGQLTFFVIFLWITYKFIHSNAWAKSNSKYIYIVSFLMLSIFIYFVISQKDSRLTAMFYKIFMYKGAALNPGEAAVSIDIRTEFFRKVFLLISERPIVGWGVGGHEPELLRMISLGVTREQQFTFTNPHNEFLLWTVQLGILGLLFFCFWLQVIWSYTKRTINSNEIFILQSWLIVFVIGCMFNSYLMDFTEGYMTVLLLSILIPFRKHS